MNHEKVNSILRALVLNLLKTGKYKKRDICIATFGGGSSPQFEHFLKGSDVGIRPLLRIFESFGYELEIVPVPKEVDDARTSKSLETLDSEFIADSRKSLIDYLDSLEPGTSTRGSVSKVFVEKADEILNDLLK